MNQLLCIVGPTGTGKTKLALHLASLFPSILISADSRQVYRGMDIVTGKDHPEGIDLLGVDLVDPTEPCSVSVWYDAVMPPIIHAWGEGKLPIVVGGTGLYVKALISGIPTIKIPLNPALRKSLARLTVQELQAKLQTLDHPKFAQLNSSDVHNPRRLIRAIEVALSPLSPLESNISSLESYIIGLHYFDNSNYGSKVRQRVLARLRLGALKETDQLLTTSTPQALTALGYRSLAAHLRGELTHQQMVDSWVHDELAYSKRQMTYFRKLKDVRWYDAATLKPDIVATQVKAWYDKSYGNT